MRLSRTEYLNYLWAQKKRRVREKKTNDGEIERETKKSRENEKTERWKTKV